ncbi:hypothetical protein [Phenylobacterium sp.]|uniref:hypothetical protein n=1 Tax=Phenylobacterium sp. TaxID=1871053 RepID=UPI0025D17576|nr:hypothetical protein [Phenylobacterium sp.]
MTLPLSPDLTKWATASLVGLAGLTFTIVSWFINRRTERERRDDQLLTWGAQCLAAMANIEALCLHGAYWPDAEFNKRRVELAAQASALLDQGRIFFPNVAREGRSEQSGDKGLRPKILDELRLAYLIAEDLLPGRTGHNRQRRDELWDGRGRFVGYLRVAVGDKRKRRGPAGEPGRSVELAPLTLDGPPTRAHRR